MGSFVQPKVFLVGATGANVSGIIDYLKYTKQEEFLQDINTALDSGISYAEVLCSLFAKLCYKSLVVGKNANISKTREIKKNLEATYDAAHGSVFEHVGLNFLLTDVSRVLTHEAVRHRVGTAFSQTSGRYCRLDSIDLVWDPILDPVKELFDKCAKNIEDTVYLAECKLGLRKPPERLSDNIKSLVEHNPLWWKYHSENGPAPELQWVPDNSFDFDKRKKITSAIRRIAPNGQSNEIAMSINIRALRHIVQLRTAPGAEWEIRNVFAQVYHLVAAQYPTIFYKAKTRMIDEQLQVYGMRLQPYEIEAGDPKALSFWTTADLKAEVANRELAE